MNGEEANAVIVAVVVDGDDDDDDGRINPTDARRPVAR